MAETFAHREPLSTRLLLQDQDDARILLHEFPYELARTV